MILSEIVPHDLSPRYLTGVKLDEKVKEAVSDLEAARRLHERYNDRGYTISLWEIADRVHDLVHPVRLASINTSGGLPTQLKVGVDWYKSDYYGNNRESVTEPQHERDREPKFRFTNTDPLGCAAQTPLTSLDNLRKIAADFSLAIMPWEALDERALKDRPNGTGAFIRNAGLYMTVYALAPIRLHSLEQHVRSDDAGLTLYAPSTQMIADSLLMNIPMFRSVIGDIKGLDKRVTELERGQASLRNRVAQVERQMEETRALVIRAEAAAESARRSALALAEKQRLIVEDPLLFAVPTHLNVESDSGHAFLGPCWGADIPDQVVEKLGYKRIETRNAYAKRLHWN